MAGRKEPIEVKFCLFDGRRGGANKYDPATTVTALKELILARWPRAFYQVAILLALNFKGLSLLRLQNDNPAHAEMLKNTFIFNTFVLCQVLNEFNARKPDQLNIFKGITGNHLHGHYSRNGCTPGTYHRVPWQVHDNSQVELAVVVCVYWSCFCQLPIGTPGKTYPCSRPSVVRDILLLLLLLLREERGMNGANINDRIRINDDEEPFLLPIPSRSLNKSTDPHPLGLLSHPMKMLCSTWPLCDEHRIIDAFVSPLAGYRVPYFEKKGLNDVVNN